MVIEPGAGENEFKATTTLKSIKNGSTITRTGTSLVDFYIRLSRAEHFRTRQ